MSTSLILIVERCQPFRACVKMHFDSREMQRGVRKVFDELVNYPGYQDHELKAFYEFLVPLNAAKRLQADSMRQLKALFCSSEPQFKHTS